MNQLHYSLDVVVFVVVVVVSATKSSFVKPEIFHLIRRAGNIQHQIINAIDVKVPKKRFKKE